MSADLRREEIARQNAIDVLRQLVAATFEPDERLVDRAVRHNPDWRPFPSRVEADAAIENLVRSQDTATARIADPEKESFDERWAALDATLPEGLRLYEVYVGGRQRGGFGATVWDETNDRPAATGYGATAVTAIEAAVTEARAVLSGETRTDGETDAGSPSGVWTTTSHVTPDQVEAARPVLMDALKGGHTYVEVAGHPWRWSFASPATPAATEETP